MPQERLLVGIVVRRTEPVSRWAKTRLVPVAVLPAAPALGRGAAIGAASAGLSYAGAAELQLHSGETGHYRDNLRTGRPMLWVAVGTGAGAGDPIVTADPYEGEALASDDARIVQPVEMPAPIRTVVESFFAAHHVERVFEKRKRKRADPDALARRAPGPGGRR